MAEIDLVKWLRWEVVVEGRFWNCRMFLNFGARYGWGMESGIGYDV